jgi:hypothetical protein
VKQTELENIGLTISKEKEVHMPKGVKNKSNLFGNEEPSAEVGYSEEQEKQDLVELGVIEIDDVVLADPIEPTELEPSDIFSTIEEQKKMISTWKNQIAMLSDRSKLKRAKILLNLIEKGMENISDDEVQQRMKDALNTAFDQKMYVDSIIALSKEMTNLLRLDSINEAGDAGAVAIQLTTASGTEIKIAAE